MYFNLPGELAGNRVFAAGNLAGKAPGPAVVLLHGAAMDHSIWVYHTRYFMHIGRPVIALDLPGHGRSAGAPLPTVEAMAAWVLACCDALELPEIALAGHSMGALAALAAAGAAPARVSRLALLGCAFPMSVSDVLLNEARIDSQTARNMMMLWGHGGNAQIGGNPVAGIHIIQFAMRLLERAVPGVLFNDLNACNSYARGFDDAAQVRARTTLICGTDDKMTPLPAAHELAGRLSGARIERVAGSGHIMMSEQPEATHRALVAALA